VPLASGEIAEDLTYYFATSEQTPSAVALGVLVDRDCTARQAGGFIVQALPQAKDEVLAKVESNINSMPYITNLLEEGLSQDEILAMISGDLGFIVNDTLSLEYYCNCSRERFEKGLVSLGSKELIDILDSD
jgi:molecular chaperone Hsp33